jgi:CheY-like chemotaxis protein
MLIADDSAVSRKLVEYALSDNRYVLIFAKNGQEAVQRVEEHNPELIILDWLMPGPDRTRNLPTYPRKTQRSLRVHHRFDWQIRKEEHRRGAGGRSRRLPNEAL